MHDANAPTGVNRSTVGANTSTIAFVLELCGSLAFAEPKTTNRRITGEMHHTLVCFEWIRYFCVLGRCGSTKRALHHVR